MSMGLFQFLCNFKKVVLFLSRLRIFFYCFDHYSRVEQTKFYQIHQQNQYCYSFRYKFILTAKKIPTNFRMFYTLGLNSQDTSLLPHRQRYIPTFVHQDIFAEQPQNLKKIGKCTPTFHSTALQTEGYNIPTQHNPSQTNRQNRTQSAHKVKYLNQSRMKRVQDLDTYNRSTLNSPKRDFWFDHTKQDLLKTKCLGGLNNYAKQRKYKELSSDLVFTNYQYNRNNQVRHAGNSRNVAQGCLYDPNLYRINNQFVNDSEKRTHMESQKMCGCGPQCKCPNCPHQKAKGCPSKCCEKCGKCSCGPKCKCQKCPEECPDKCKEQCCKQSGQKKQCPCGSECKCKDCPTSCGKECASKCCTDKKAQTSKGEQKTQQKEQTSTQKNQSQNNQFSTANNQAENKLQTDKHIKLKGKKIEHKIQTKPKIVSEKPTFTVIRRKQIPIF